MKVPETQSPLLDAYEAAHYLDLKHPGTLSNWRLQGVGPTYIRVGRNIRYLKSDLDQWLQNQRVASASMGRSASYMKGAANG